MVFGPYRGYKELLPIERVRELSQLRPRRAVLDCMRCWMVILAAWTAVAVWTQWWVVLLAIPVIGTQYYGLFVIGHDGMHGRVFKRRRHNDLFCDLIIYGPILGITRINNRNHLEHHRTLSTDADPDRPRHACFNKATRPAYLRFLTGVAMIGHRVVHAFGRGRDEELDERPGPRSGKGYTIRDAAILMGWQAALIGGLTLAIGWWAYPVLWLLPVGLHTYLADLVRSFFEHSHPEADAKADEHRLITHTSNRLERAFLAPMNMNCHTVHHLWPSIPYYNLPVADREIRNRPGTEGLTWRGSYLAYAWRYFRALPLVECQEEGRRAAQRTASAGA